MKDKFFFFLFLVFGATLLFTGDSLAFNQDDIDYFKNHTTFSNSLILENKQYGCKPVDYSLNWYNLIEKGSAYSPLPLNSAFFDGLKDNMFKDDLLNYKVSIISESHPKTEYPSEALVFLSRSAFDVKFRLSSHQNSAYKTYNYSFIPYSVSDLLSDNANVSQKFPFSLAYDNNNWRFDALDFVLSLRIRYTKEKGKCRLLAFISSDGSSNFAAFSVTYSNKPDNWINIYQMNHPLYRDYSTDLGFSDYPSFLSIFENVEKPQLSIDNSNSNAVSVTVLESSAFGSFDDPNAVELREALKVSLKIYNRSTGAVLVNRGSYKSNTSPLDYHLTGGNSITFSVSQHSSTDLTGEACYILPDNKKHLLPFNVTGLGCRYFNLALDSSNPGITDVLDNNNESSSDVSNSINKKDENMSGLGNVFNFNWLNPFAGIFGLFKTGANCVSLPIIGGMLNAPNNQYCPWFKSDVRDILTPVIGLSSFMLLFGVFVRWLKDNSDDSNMLFDYKTKIPFLRGRR